MPPVIEVVDLHRTYMTGATAVRAVRGVNLRVEHGEFLAIMGASGSGKSTLMNLLGCLDRPTGGTYRLEGTDVSRLDSDALAAIRNAKIGFVFQGFNLLSRTTALENVELPMLYANPTLPGAERRARAARALAQVGLADRLQHVPGELSGGQQQRVAIARALVLNPSLLLADEPTGNLDTRTSIELMAIFQQLNDAGMTVVMVTHEPDIARYARRTVVMRDGKISSDRPVTGHRTARADLLRLPAADAGSEDEAAVAVSGTNPSP